MQKFNSAGVEIAYEVGGQGPPILLIHGFASNSFVNWRDTHWVKVLSEAGRQVITIDNRGHGQSEKLYDPEQYSAQLMADDAFGQQLISIFTQLGGGDEFVFGEAQYDSDTFKILVG